MYYDTQITHCMYVHMYMTIKSHTVHVCTYMYVYDNQITHCTCMYIRTYTTVKSHIVHVNMNIATVRRIFSVAVVTVSLVLCTNLRHKSFNEGGNRERGICV